MKKEIQEEYYLLGLDVSTKTIGVALFNNKGQLLELTHISPIPKPKEENKIKELSEYANRKEEISIDLEEEKIVYGNNEIKFQVDPFKKKCLLEGLDDIALSLKKSDKIEDFETNLKNKMTYKFNSKNGRNFEIDLIELTRIFMLSVFGR